MWRRSPVCAVGWGFDESLQELTDTIELVAHLTPAHSPSPYRVIPYRLSLRNFLSYRQASLDFRGLHTACICGSNGAGKSSLLEAMTWCLWGESRAASDDDVIHLGAGDVRVDFMFQSQGNVYRVIRSRHRKQSTSLEFQIAQFPTQSPVETSGETPAIVPVLAAEPSTWSFRSLTDKGVRATQQRIIQTLKLDYETFVNSAYLRQGRADEFMLKRPTERKQVLADLLKLDQYDRLADQAKERSRDFKTQAGLLEQTLASLSKQVQEQTSLAQDEATLQASLSALQIDQERDRLQLESLQTQQQQHHSLLQQQQFLAAQRDRLQPNLVTLQQERDRLQHQLTQVDAILSQTDTITRHYHHWQTLQQQEEQLSHTAQTHQQLQQQLQQLQQRLDSQHQDLQRQLEQIDTKLDTLTQQDLDLQPILSRADDIADALQKLTTARDRLQHFETLQAQVTPLLQQRQQLNTQIHQTRTRLDARLNELRSLQQQLLQHQQRLPQLQEEFDLVNRQVEYLDERKRYQDRVRDRGLERRSFLERLKTHRQTHQTQLRSLDEKLQPLQPGLPCPLCSQPLDQAHWQIVQQQHRQETQELQDMVLVIQEQISVSEREIEILRDEYRTIERELLGYSGFLERRGQLQQLISSSLEAQGQLQHTVAAIIDLETQLQRNSFEPELHQDLHQLDHLLHALAYDDRNHALAKSDVERWRWAEIKQAEIRQAQYRQAQIQQQRPLLNQERDRLLQALQALSHSPLKHQLQDSDRALTALNYNLDQHNHLRQALRDGQPWPLRYQNLRQAQEQHPQLHTQLTTLQQQLDHLHTEDQQLQQQQLQLSHRLQTLPDPTPQIQALQQQIQNRRPQIDQFLAQLGRLQQQQQQLQTLQQQHTQQTQQLQYCRHQQRLHQELAQAFGKNGIQALMIENLLPQLEHETNQILARLSGNQLHVQFITQKSRRSGGEKLIDTLDIRIADARGTRPYETYSGGEAFRVNFSIRLALARILAQRSGTTLQLLIVDEGFGTQDADGCDRLIAAINAIASDFACILTITHMPQFKEAFSARIEVQKTAEGSTLHLV